MTPDRFLARRVAVALALALALGLAAAQAQNAASAASAPAGSSPAKRELAKRLLALQQPGFDALSRSLVEGPARQLLASAEPVLRNQVADKREAVAKQLQDEARKYVDDATPAVRKRAQELAQSQVLPALEEKYTEDELRQIVTFYESAAYKKMQQVQPQVDQGLQQKLVADMSPAVEGKARALQATMAKLLGVPAQQGAASGAGGNGAAGSGLKPPAPRPAAPAASKP